MRTRITRRTFVKRASAVGAALMVAPAARVVASDVAPRAARKTLRIGCLNVSAYSHLPNWWGPLINPRRGGTDAPYTGMRMTHCWELNFERSKGFADQYDCVAVKNFDDMLGEVDGIISGGYHCHGWNHILHEPYLKAGLPNLINRPLSNSVAKARKIIETAQKHGAKILNPSAYEHTNTIARAQAWVKGKKIISYSATTGAADYPTHGIHGVYMIVKAIAEAGNPVVSVAYRANSWHKQPGVITYEHRDPQGRQFFGTLHLVSDSLGTIRIHTPEEYGGRGFRIYTGTGPTFGRTEFWAPTIWAFQRMALFGEMPETYEQILHKSDVFLAGWRSVLENNGRPVRLDELPTDWETPIKIPGNPNNAYVDELRKTFG